MTTEFMKELSGIFLKNIAAETPVTEKVIAAIPEGNHDYKPDEKSKTAIDLAWHTVTSDIWFLESIANHKFGDASMEQPAEIKSGGDIAAWYNKKLVESMAKVEAMSGEELSTPIDFYGMFNLPAAFYLQFMASHMIHHRGQLTTYLRPMGGKVPSIYGGSADEPMGM